MALSKNMLKPTGFESEETPLTPSEYEKALEKYNPEDCRQQLQQQPQDAPGYACCLREAGFLQRFPDEKPVPRWPEQEADETGGHE